MYQSVLTFITFLCLWTHVWAHVVVINVLHDSNSNASKAGLMAVQFLEQMKLNAAECGTQVTCEVYVSKSASANMSQAVKADLTRIAKRQFMFHGVTPITDTSVGSYVPEEEHVSEILSSLDENVKRHASPTEALISLSFTSYSYPIFGKSFHHILNNVSSKTNPVDVLLFEKTKELTSVSDWHDLMIVAVGLREGAKAWCRLLSAIYKRHAARDVFTLLPPRPAIIETALRIRDKVSIAYIPASAVCVAPLEDIPPERFTRFFRHGGHTSYCGALPTSNDTMKIDCGDSKTYSSHVCATVHSPQGWRRDAHPLTDPISDRYRNDFSSNPLDFASVEDFLRYRNATDPETPADFCWNTGSETYEDPPASKVHIEANSSYTYTKPSTREEYSASRLKFVVLTSSDGSSSSVSRHFYQALNKQYYAHRHGYLYKYVLSNHYLQFFGPRFLENTVLGAAAGWLGTMAKVLAVLSQLFDNPEADWLLFTDDDMFINNQWLHLPLEVFVDDVPEDKILVMANYRSAQSNSFFIRNSIEGRAFVMDWLAVVMSGYVQCHGFDQAGLEYLILSRQVDGKTIKSANPLNFSCVDANWITKEDNQKRVRPETMQYYPSSPGATWGCGLPGVWSCDFEYENSFTDIGFHSRTWGFYKELSSISKGCANDYIRDLHVVAENTKRPRLHCTYCAQTDRLIANMNLYDGALGAGNDWVRLDAIDGWFMNHKWFYTFFDEYLKPSACMKNPNFIPPCDSEAERLFLEAVGSQEETLKEARLKHPKMIMSMVDGLAYDFSTKAFCKGTLKLLEYQKTNSHMRDYKKMINLAKSISETDFAARRLAANPIPAPIGTAQDTDPGFHASRRTFEDKDFCNRWCRPQYQPLYTNPKGEHYVLNCNIKNCVDVYGRCLPPGPDE